MKTFKVCAKDEVLHYIEANGHTHVLTLLDYNESCHDLTNKFTVQNWRRLNFMDVEFPGHPAGPTKKDCEQILEWGRDLPEDANVLVHCHAGMSRSTCATLALMVQAFPLHDMKVHKDELLSIRHIAIPNKLMAIHFDDLLGQNGMFKKVVWEIHAMQDERYMWNDNGPQFVI